MEARERPGEEAPAEQGADAPAEAGGNVIPAPRAARSEPSRLRDAIRRARLTDVERSDVIVDLREAEVARLELLQDSLADVRGDIPADTDLFEFRILPGSPPRLWIDVLAHVSMGRDKRTYRFVQENRHGRHVVLETANMVEMAGRVTDYVARRMLERERALVSDTMPLGLAEAGEAGAERAAEPEVATMPQRRFGWPMVIVTFLLGLLCGAVGLFAGSLWLMGL